MSNDQTTEWTPDQPLRAGADIRQVQERSNYLLFYAPNSDHRTPTEADALAIRELAAAEVKAYRERVRDLLSECEYTATALRILDRIPLTTEAP